MDTVTFRIGGQDVVLGPLTIWSLRQCWSDIEALAKIPPTALERFHTNINIVSSGWRLKDPSKTSEEIERIMLWDEAKGLEEGIIKLLHISGFKPDPVTDASMGEDQAAIPVPVSSGMESSPNSAPMA